MALLRMEIKLLDNVEFTILERQQDMSEIYWQILLLMKQLKVKALLEKSCVTFLDMELKHGYGYNQLEKWHRSTFG